jgi:competence CoiA-like predicted nuclease
MYLAKLKKIFVYFFLSLVGGGICFMFYKEQIKIYLPTEMPTHFKTTNYGQKFDLKPKKKLKLIHFFNPDCPCSKFNKRHFEFLISKYQSEVEFEAYSHTSIPANFPIEVKFDTNNRMAKILGVFSTPQAVLLDADGKLIYRGNYNQNRYCSSKKTEFVAQAIALALHKKSTLSVMQKSGLPYGCKIFN